MNRWELAMALRGMGLCRRLAGVAVGVVLTFGLGHALVPLYANAVVDSQSTRLVPVCSASGLVWMRLGTEEALDGRVTARLPN